MKNTKKQVVSMNRKDFYNEILRNWKFGAQPASIQYLTTPKINEEGKTLFGEVKKVANVGVMIGYSYEGAVKNQKEREHKEREFLAQPLWKGKGYRVSTACAAHVEKGEKYLTYKKQQTFRSFYFDAALNMLTSGEVKPYFPKSDPGKYQGLDKPIYHREIDLNNVQKVKFRGTTYVLNGEI
jgi:hypothetical protein